MAITIQLTEVPANESVANRVFTLSKNGGDFGSAFDCDIQLPDRSGQVAAKHGCFIVKKNKMTVQAYAGHNLAIQGNPLAPGKSEVIEDGTIISVADYIMLISIVANTDDEDDNSDLANEPERSYQAYFSHSSLEEDLEDSIVMKSNITDTIKGQTMAQDKTPHFASSGVFSDDPFEDDPFKDEEISLDLGTETVPDNNSFTDNDENIETYVADESDNVDADVILMNKTQLNTLDRETSSQSNGNNQQISQLVSLLEEQIVSQNEQQSKILQVIDKTLSSFLSEFSPAHLEDVFDDFGTPFFVQKEKQYWRSYRKSFSRRLDKGEYHRLFKALLLENMQASPANNDKSKKAGND